MFPSKVTRQSHPIFIIEILYIIRYKRTVLFTFMLVNRFETYRLLNMSILRSTVFLPRQANARRLKAILSIESSNSRVRVLMRS